MAEGDDGVTYDITARCTVSSPSSPLTVGTHQLEFQYDTNSRTVLRIFAEQDGSPVYITVTAGAAPTATPQPTAAPSAQPSASPQPSPTPKPAAGSPDTSTPSGAQSAPAATPAPEAQAAGLNKTGDEYGLLLAGIGAAAAAGIAGLLLWRRKKNRANPRQKNDEL